MVERERELLFGEIVFVDAIAARKVTKTYVSWEAVDIEPKIAYYTGYTYKRAGTIRSDTVFDIEDGKYGNSFDIDKDILLIRLKFNLRGNEIFAFPKNVQHLSAFLHVERVYDNKERIIKMVWR